MDGVNSMTGNPPDLKAFAVLARAHDALLYLDDAHGFGVVGERARDEPCAYGMRGNGVVRHLGETYDHIVLTGGFSKAYSSLLAFIAGPSALKRLLKVAAPPYLYSGPHRSLRWPARWSGCRSTTAAATSSAPCCMPGPAGCWITWTSWGRPP
jgi:8-amino-7-oxononanoate synthase